MRTLLQIGIVLAVVAVGCSDDEAATSVTDASTTVVEVTTSTVAVDEFFPPTGATDVVLRMAIHVNQPDPLPILEAFPEFTLYGDGTLLAHGGDGSNLTELQVDSEGIQTLLQLAVQLGALDPLEDYGPSGLADASSTSFVVDTGTEKAEFGVSALTATSPEMTDEQVAARSELVSLRDTLRNVRVLLGDHIASEQPFVPEAIAVFGMDRGGGSGGPEVPFDLLVDGETVTTRVAPVSCIIATGADLDALMEVLAGADSDRFQDVRGWEVVIRPILPDERPQCAGLASAQ